MARKYNGPGESIGEAGEHGLRLMTTTQTIGKDEVPVTYYTFGIEADAPALWVKWVSNVVAGMSPAEQAVEYERWVYGVDLSARQKGKQGGPAEPWVIGGKDVEVNLVDGSVRTKSTGEVIPGKMVDLARRCHLIGIAVDQAAVREENLPRAYASGLKGLTDAGLVKVGPDGKPVPVPSGATAPAAPAPAAPARPVRGGSK